jgi:hypothetical protein
METSCEQINRQPVNNKAVLHCVWCIKIATDHRQMKILSQLQKTEREFPLSRTWFWKRSFEYQYSETNVMYFLFSLLRIKGLYMFRTLLVHPQEALHRQHLVYCVRVMSVGSYQVWSGTGVGDTSSTPTNWHDTHAIYQVPFVKNLLRMRK